METPIVKLSNKDLDTVYEPSEDSFLLIDALEADLETFKSQKSQLCLEIGSGSGIVITALAAALKKYNGAYFCAIDLNPNACKVTKETSIANSTNIDVIQMDLTNNIYARGIFDIILFNPPYVVTESLEVLDERLISKTWAGGKEGREVMERLFENIPKLLSDNGYFYLVVIKENDPEYIIQIFKDLDMKGEVVMDRKVRGEHLHILRFKKTGQN
ncbi:hemK methyltransferase family member 2 [Cephus cinctus]|uniref:Methyltransferase HEMK2 n=1 Tax=Cephus cinctus TaxID=211228 RepID=A0AAJ7FN92_CEPCN|nr:hemK methyltransferase family member 2 [Cephus cinctus]